MKHDLRELIKDRRIYCDGGFGSILQSMGLPVGTPPEMWNLDDNSEKIYALNRSYVEAGANVINTNTFGVNSMKYPDRYEDMIKSAVSIAKRAAEGYDDVYVAFDIGPTGRLLEPLGDLPFEDAVKTFADGIKAAVKEGVDLILIETMNDSFETKAAVIAAKENSELPVFVTNAYDENGKLISGADPKAMIALLEGLGVDALGMNCSFGPDRMLDIIDQFAEFSSLPVIVNPNAGLPEVRDGKTCYNIDPDKFTEYMIELAGRGACILGGCCGTTPEHIRKTVFATKDMPYSAPSFKTHTLVTSYTHAVEIGPDPVLIGERINPTGKKKFKEALRNNDIDYIVGEGLRQAEKGVHILDVNVGLPEIDEKTMMMSVVSSLQAVTDEPLQLDSSDPLVLEAAMRIYNGKPLINSVNGKEEVMDAVFPLVKRYGGTVIGLTIGHEGIPATSDGRVDIALRIIEHAASYGIDRKDIIIDPLAMAVSSDPRSALVTIDTVRRLHDMGIKTSLGVSNISFGLPGRPRINAAFFSEALENGLNCAIMNPFTTEMMDSYYAFRVLHALDTNCESFISYVSELESQTQTVAASSVSAELTLRDAVFKGLSGPAKKEAARLLETTEPVEVINNFIIPGLNDIGDAFENKKAFLPQLLVSAEAASAAFEVVKSRLSGSASDKSEAMVLATVKGDIHDIGKNIVKVMMESYGFYVYDMGRDVPPEVILGAVKEHNCKLVGLSALMTTTVPAMEETIRILHEYDPSIKVCVGGAVLNQEYADMIHADFYGKNAIDTVKYAEKYYGRK